MKTGTMRETAVGHRETLQAIYPAALVVERQQPCNYQLRSRNGDNRTRHQNPRHDDDAETIDDALHRRRCSSSFFKERGAQE